MQITTECKPPQARGRCPENESQLGFGRIFADHMFRACWSRQEGWHRAEIVPYGDIAISPAALVLHYGQTIFEGLKAYRRADGGVNLFRLDANLKRLNRSGAQVALPPVDPALLQEAILRLIAIDHAWIPHTHGASLYLRPFMFAVEPYVGLKATDQVWLMVITGPVGPYYPEGFNPVRLMVSEKYIRAAPGGLGAAKTAANYAASLLAESEALAAGYTQVLWLDAIERRYLEEVGSMNILLHIDGRVITPPVGETILDGITRDSALELLRAWGVPVEERRITIDEVLAAQRDGSLTEIFGAGTAAVISPVGLLHHRGEDFRIADGQTGPLAQRLFNTLMDMQYGKILAPEGWIREALPPPPSEAAVAGQPIPSPLTTPA